MHVTGGTCASGPPGAPEGPEGTCPPYRWADARLRQWEATRGRVHERAPAWQDVDRHH